MLKGKQQDEHRWKWKRKKKKTEEKHRRTCGTDWHLLLHLATGCNTNKGDILNKQGNVSQSDSVSLDMAQTALWAENLFPPTLFFFLKWADQWTASELQVDKWASNTGRYYDTVFCTFKSEICCALWLSLSLPFIPCGSCEFSLPKGGVKSNKFSLSSFLTKKLYMWKIRSWKAVHNSRFLHFSQVWRSANLKIKLPSLSEGLVSLVSAEITSKQNQSSKSCVWQICQAFLTYLLWN